MGRTKKVAVDTNRGLSAEQILQKYWGYTEFRSRQKEIINSVLSGIDTLALLPTGGGKSITYQIPTLMSEGVCVVISPIIALMKDQVDGLRRRGISAVAVHSGLSRKEIDRALDNCVYGDVKFLYLSPERAETDIFLMRLQRMNVSLFAVDEAHCISQWGYDFRPSYLNISKLREVMPQVPMLALSASATDIVAADIMRQLKFERDNIIRTALSRPNLSYVVRCDDNKRLQIQNVLHRVEGSGIIYANTRDECEELCEWLHHEGVSATYYHAGIPHAERMLRQEDWLKGVSRVIVATNAFGMGIDKPDVRFVIHHSMCASLEAYYQEAGRAGRDGGRSYALLLLAERDEKRIRGRVDMEFPPLEDIKKIYDSVCSFLMIPYEDGAFKSYKFNIYEFCQKRKLFGLTVRSALKLLEMNGYLTYIEDASIPARVIFRVSREELYRITISDSRTEAVLNSLLRLYSGLFSDLRRVDEGEIAAWCQISFEEVVEALKELSMMRVIYYISASFSPIIRLYSERAKVEEIFISPESYTHRRRMCEDRVSKMLEYTNNQNMCRSSLLEGYFGEKNPKECGVCDICIGKKHKRVDTSEVKQNVIEIIEQEAHDVQQLIAKINCNPTQVTQAIEELISESKLRYNGAFLEISR